MITRRSILAGMGSVASLGVLPSCSWANTPPAPVASTLKEGFAALSASALALVDDGDVAGIALGVSGVGVRKSAYFGFANLESRTPVSADTQFRIASITKPMVAACALQMEEEGALSLSSTVAEFFPEFPRASDVSLTHLLQHTSGLANWWDRMPAGTPDDFMNRPDAVQWLARMRDPYLFAPGTMRTYSNSGFVLLGKILERAAGNELDSVMRDYVFHRVGAGATGFETMIDRPRSNWAAGYQSELLGFERAELVPPPYAAGGLRSTLHDVLAFGDAVFLGPLLEDATRDRMVAHARVADGRLVQDAQYEGQGILAEQLSEDVTELGYGLGINTWVQWGERFYSHAGLIDGFASYFLHAPRTGLTFSVLTNTFAGTGELNQQARDLFRELS